MKTPIKVILAALAAAALLTPATADAKAYKTKSEFVLSGRTKTVNTDRKIKKITVCSSNKKFRAAKKGKYKFRVSGTDVGKNQAVKVTYTNGNTQKFRFTTAVDYQMKVVNELKSLMRNPDAGLRKIVAEWETKTETEKNGNYTFLLREILPSGSTKIKYDLNGVINKYTVSQKKALIMEVYFRTHMAYSKAAKGAYLKTGKALNNEYKKIYDGTFKGVCSDGSVMGKRICQKLNIPCKYVTSHERNHGWLVVKATDTDGTAYWHDVWTTSNGWNLRTSVKSDETRMHDGDIGLTIAGEQKYEYNPVHHMTFMNRVTTSSLKKPSSTTVYVPADPTPAPQTPTAPTTPSPAPSDKYVCPGCDMPCRHTSAANPYVTNMTTRYKDYVIYKHISNGTTRYFDASGNEYIDANGNGSITDELIVLANQ